MIRPVLLILALSACNIPGRNFEGLSPTRVRVGEMVFDVRVRGDLAEAIRVNPQWAPRLSGVKDPAAIAMAHVSGCRVTEVRGDQALVLGLLDCGGRTRRRKVDATVEFDCHVEDAWESEGLNQRIVVLDCEPGP